MLLLFTLVVSVTKGLPHPSLPYLHFAGIEVDGTTKVPGEPSQESAASPYSNPPHLQLCRLDKGICILQYWLVFAITCQETFKNTLLVTYPETPLFRCTSAPSILLPTSARCDRYPDCPTGEVNHTIPYQTIHIPYGIHGIHSRLYAGPRWRRELAAGEHFTERGHF